MKSGFQASPRGVDSHSLIYLVCVFLVAAATAFLRLDYFPVLENLLFNSLSIGFNAMTAPVANLIVFTFSFFPSLAVLMSYLIGKKVDFALDRFRLVSVSLSGAFVGSIPGIYLSTSSHFGSGWGWGFGYFTSYGYDTGPSLILVLTASTVSSFMVPVAGLALAFFGRLKSLSPTGELKGAKGERYWRKVILFVGFLLAAAAYPISTLVRFLFPPLFTGPIMPLQYVDPWRDLVPGYVGFVVYPVLLLITFYFLGKRLALESLNPFLLGVQVFMVGIIGMLIGALVGGYVENPARFLVILDPTRLPRLSFFLLTTGLLFAFLGLGSASVGSAKGVGRPPTT